MPRAKAALRSLSLKPVAGKASLVWDEAQKLTGRDPDFHRRRSMGGHRSRGLPGI
ncbi:hypothetical protein LNP74_23500 [Klebsiella pneumoniae subsp. pneumoniae]|nr:hypothetical protein [Klebsiella pneumoniae subsp. pneumoniae]